MCIELVNPSAVDTRQEIYDMLHGVKDDYGWTVIMSTRNEGEISYIGIKKGRLILELITNPKL